MPTGTQPTPPRLELLDPVDGQPSFLPSLLPTPWPWKRILGGIVLAWLVVG